MEFLLFQEVQILLQLSRSYAPEDSQVQQDIIDGIKSILQQKQDSNYTTLSDTIVLVDEDDLSALQVTGGTFALRGSNFVVACAKVQSSLLSGNPKTQYLASKR